MKELNKKLAIIQTKLKAKKSSYNSFGKYYFRKAEDILEAIKPFLIEHGVTVTINEQIIATDPVPTLQSTATISDGENSIHATALVGVDLNQKGMQTSQQFGAASTYGKKYSLGNLLLIDDTQDADADNKHGVVDKIKAKAKPAITADQLKKAKEYITAGGNISAIESKYKLTNEQKNKYYKKLKEDEHYYGTFGKQYLSNSDISTLLNNPLQLGKPSTPNPNFLVGGYFHTAILEPEKLASFKIVESTSRNTKQYKEISGGEMCLLQHEADNVNLMTDKLMANDICNDLVRGTIHPRNSITQKIIEYEVPMIKEIEGVMWKGKADIINHEEKLVIDLKTTGDIDRFQWSAKKFNYDSQAYIYRELFGYEMLFIAIDKKTHQIGMFDCSPKFYESGKEKVIKAIEVYDLFYKTDDFDPAQYFINKTL